MMEPAASTRAPAAASRSTTSRVLPPVVTTSSITTAVVPGSTEKPRLRVIWPSASRSAKTKRAAQGSRHFVSDNQAADGGRGHHIDRSSRPDLPDAVRKGPSQAFRMGGMLQHQGALEVLGAVQAAGQPEMAAKIGAGLVEQCQDFAFLRCHKCLLYHWRFKELRCVFCVCTYLRRFQTGPRIEKYDSQKFRSRNHVRLSDARAPAGQRPGASGATVAGLSARWNVQRHREALQVSRGSSVQSGQLDRLESLLRAGRIYLSLQDAIALALENNLDIELQRYGPRIADTDILRAKAGSTLRGVSTSVSAPPAAPWRSHRSWRRRWRRRRTTAVTTGAGVGTPNLDPTATFSTTGRTRPLRRPIRSPRARIRWSDQHDRQLRHSEGLPDRHQGELRLEQQPVAN